MRHFIEDYESNKVQLFMVRNEETLELLNKVFVMCLKLAVAAFFAIVILFYKVAAVNFVFLEKHILSRNISRIYQRPR